MREMTEREKVAHLLRRFGLGASEAEVDYYGKDGLKDAIDRLLNFESVPSNFDIDPSAYANRQGVVNLQVMRALWYLRMLATHRPLEEKIALFWHNHFATSAQKVDSAYAMSRQIDLFRQYGLGSFYELLEQVSKDPAMIYWLDNHENVKGKPNENFAREVMELFTLGIGHYTEQDVQEASRAFTGWTFGAGRRPASLEGARAPIRIHRYMFVPDRHDDGPKTLFGKTANFTGEDVLKMLCDHPQTSVFLAKKMWEWFAYENPEAALVERLAKTFRESKLNIKALVRAVMEAPEFYSAKCVRKAIKHPIDFVIATCRQLGVGEIAMQRVRNAIAEPQVNEQTGLNVRLIAASSPAFATAQATASMGMELLYPPDVSGWRTGTYWITTSTMVERVKWAERLFAGAALGGGVPAGTPGARRAAAVNFDATELFAQNPTPEGVVDVLVSVFDVPVKPETRETFLAAARKAAGGAAINRANANDVARAVTKLIFGSPEFQFA